MPQYKLDKLKMQLCEIQKAHSVPARCLASLIGKNHVHGPSLGPGYPADDP